MENTLIASIKASKEDVSGINAEIIRLLTAIEGNTRK
jgi:hypothetical protein